MRALGRIGRQEATETFPDSPLVVVAKGALAGFAGTLALTVAVQGAQRVSRHGGNGGRRPEESGAEAGLGAARSLAGRQVQAPFLSQSTEIFVQKVATGLFGASPSGTALAAAGAAMHFAYGGFWGAIYGLLQASLRLPPRLHGVLYGLAEMVVWAAAHAPREMLIGRPTVQAAWGQRLAPALLDWYLGRYGYEPQTVDLPNEQEGDILWRTLPGDPGAHGPYRDREQGADLHMRLRTHPRVLAAAAALSGLMGLAAIGAHIGRNRT